MSAKSDLLVQRIHADFDKAAEAVVEQAKAILNISEDRRSMLRSLGMNDQPEVKEFTDMLEFRSTLSTLTKLFPGYKIMERSSLRPILRKYRLVDAPLAWFKGEIPTQNLRETCEFVDKVREYFRSSSLLLSVRNEMHSKNLRIIAPKKQIQVPVHEKIKNELGVLNVIPKPAPKDPVVLFVFEPFCVIVTKWGVEADYEEFR